MTITSSHELTMQMQRMMAHKHTLCARAELNRRGAGADGTIMHTDVSNDAVASGGLEADCVITRVDVRVGDDHIL